MGRSLRNPVLIIILCALASSCRRTEQYMLPPPDEPSIAPEMELANTAAYPEGSYVISPGDTPRSVATKLGVDYDFLARANGFTDRTVLSPGCIIVVPRVALRTRELPAHAGAASKRLPGALPAQEAEVKVSVDSSGCAKAVSAGEVTAVHRAYPGLGDVVIIENDVEKMIYSGRFTPSVAKGALVSVGDAVGSGVVSGGIRATRFPK